ncbi:unnamed protein product [Urochloa humidicola]
MGGLSDLDFGPGLVFQQLVRNHFSSPVIFSGSSSSREFWLMCSFSRSAIRLNIDSVGLILQSTLGGIASDFNVLHLPEWMFRFSVDSKLVGLMVHRSKSFSCPSFSIHFAL